MTIENENSVDHKFNYKKLLNLGLVCFLSTIFNSVGSGKLSDGTFGNAQLKNLDSRLDPHQTIVEMHKQFQIQDYLATTNISQVSAFKLFSQSIYKGGDPQETLEIKKIEAPIHIEFVLDKSDKANFGTQQKLAKIAGESLKTQRMKRMFEILTSRMSQPELSSYNIAIVYGGDGDSHASNSGSFIDKDGKYWYLITLYDVNAVSEDERSLKSQMSVYNEIFDLIPLIVSEQRIKSEENTRPYDIYNKLGDKGIKRRPGISRFVEFQRFSTAIQQAAIMLLGEKNITTKTSKQIDSAIDEIITKDPEKFAKYVLSQYLFMDLMGSYSLLESAENDLTAMEETAYFLNIYMGPENRLKFTVKLIPNSQKYTLELIVK